MKSLKNWRTVVLFALASVLSVAVWIVPKPVSVQAQGPGIVTLTGTGACATITSQGGGLIAGTFKCTGTTGASTVTMTNSGTPANIPPNGWQCMGSDTTTAAVGNQTAPVATTSCKLNFTSVTANDVITYEQNAF